MKKTIDNEQYESNDNGSTWTKVEEDVDFTEGENGCMVDLEGRPYVLARGEGSGVKVGFLESLDGRKLTLIKARQLYSWSSNFVLIDLAQDGPTTKWKSRFSCEASLPDVSTDCCAYTTCTYEAAKKIRSIPAENPGKDEE